MIFVANMTKYLLPLLGVLVLGAGCAADTSLTTDTTDDDLQTEPIMAAGTDAEDMDDDMIDGMDHDDMDHEHDASDTDASAPDTDDAEDPAGELDVALSMNMKSGNFFFEPSVINAKAGQDVNITFTESAGFHTFVIDAIDLKATVSADGTVSFTAPTTPGRYEFYCDVGSHAQLGMKGTLVVE